MDVSGSELASSLAAAGLIDEYRFYIVPIILGSGKPLFPHLQEFIRIKPLEVHQFKSGALLLRYGTGESKI